MDFIILDIEFNGRKFASELPMEVIEIGAVRLNSSLQPVDEFSSLIKPVYFAKLNSFIKKKTGIPQQDIDQAHGYPKVIAEFIGWLKRSEAFLLVTWGGEDLKRIIFDARMHKLDDSFWMGVEYFDLLKGFLRVKNLTNDVSVESALLDLQIATDISAHRALGDARLTSQIFQSIYQELDFGLKQQFKDTYSNSRERRLVKNAVRAMSNQKISLDWEPFAEQFLAGKIDLTDARKAAELREHFQAERSKPRQTTPGDGKNI